MTRVPMAIRLGRTGKLYGAALGGQKGFLLAPTLACFEFS